MKYQTKHREELVSYMRSIPGKHMTAGQICDCMKERGCNIGTATVYRQLEKMVDDGLLNKYIIDEGSSACYEFVPEDSHVCEGKCFHLKCEVCGKLIHLECDELNSLQDHITEHHGFSIDPYRTVFYGVCGDCSSKECEVKDHPAQGYLSQECPSKAHPSKGTGADRNRKEK